MGRLITVILAVGLVAWLANRQIGAADRAVRDIDTTTGVPEIAGDTRPPSQRISEQFGAQVESTIAAGKARIDADCSVSDDCPR